MSDNLILSILEKYQFVEDNKNQISSLINESANDIRYYAIKKLGWQEKGNELSSAGEITKELAEIVNKLLYEYKKISPSCVGFFTAGNDKYHKNLKSRHSSGEAVDLTLPSQCHASFKEVCNDFKVKYPGFQYIDEYQKPSKNATGGHFHISYKANSPEKPYSNPEPTNQIDPVTNEPVPDGQYSKYRDVAAGELFTKSLGESINEQFDFGRSAKTINGVLVIPGSYRANRIYSPISGRIEGSKSSSECKNQILLKSSNNKFYIKFCGISDEEVSTGDKISVGDMIGRSNTDVKVFLLNKNLKEVKFGSKEASVLLGDSVSSKKQKPSKETYTTRRNYSRYNDPIVGDIAELPFKAAKYLVSKVFSKKDKVEENINRIKKLL